MLYNTPSCAVSLAAQQEPHVDLLLISPDITQVHVCYVFP